MQRVWTGPVVEAALGRGRVGVNKPVFESRFCLSIICVSSGRLLAPLASASSSVKCYNSAHLLVLL